MIDKFWMWLAWILPKRLVYWCSVRLFTHATVGKYSEQVVGDLKVIDALERWK